MECVAIFIHANDKIVMLIHAFNSSLAENYIGYIILPFYKLLLMLCINQVTV